jgi:acyl carrier protein
LTEVRLMESSMIEGRVRAAILRALHLQSSPTMPLHMGSTPGWDSLGHMTVIMELEREFGVRVPVSRIADLRDVTTIAGAIASGLK